MQPTAQALGKQQKEDKPRRSERGPSGPIHPGRRTAEGGCPHMVHLAKGGARVFKSPSGKIAQSLNGFAPEEVHQLDDQNEHHQQLQHERPALVELLDHELVEVFGGLQFFFDQVFVVGHADLGRAQLVKPRRKHVAEELDGVVGALGELVDVEQNGVQLAGGLGRAPARPGSGASLFEEVVDLLQLLGHQLVVVAELEQLRVGVLQKLDGGLGAGSGVVDEGCVPSDDCEVVRIVRDARLENLLALAFGEGGGLATDDLGDLVSMGGEQVVGGGGGIALDFAHLEDEIVLLQPLGAVGLDQRGGGAFQLLPDDARGELLEVGVGGPAGGKFDELVPGTAEGQLEEQADDAVVIVLDLSREALAGFEDERLKRLFDRSALVADVGGRLLEAGFGLARGEDLAEFVEADLFAYVELDQDQHHATQGAGGLGRRGFLNCGGEFSGDFGADDGGDVAVHGSSTRYSVVSSRSAAVRENLGSRGRPVLCIYCPRRRGIGLGVVVPYVSY